MTGLDRARAEHVEQQNAEWHDDYPGAEWETTKPPADPDACTFCSHKVSEHGPNYCAVLFSENGIDCKCPRKRNTK
ncbi:MAG: hypothetical protein JWP74_1722 [Marmoricola sp.]|nr:hypothetical protein [Marmoricola sp.]